MNDNTFDFLIEDGIELPAREGHGRPRGSQYPIEQMTQGQSFFVPLEGEEGATRKDKDGNVFELTAAEDLARQMRQKQSYFSQLGKKLGLSIKTRVYADGKDFSARQAGKAGIGVWHAGPRTETDSEEEVEEAEGAE